jgi:hypothetical protein
MKHWDGRDRNDVAELRLAPPERARLAQFLPAPVSPRRQQPHTGSVIGLVLALGVLAGVAWVLAPGSPVSPRLLD